MWNQLERSRFSTYPAVQLNAIGYYYVFLVLGNSCKFRSIFRRYSPPIFPISLYLPRYDEDSWG
ncbi:MAG: hypothetical protein SWY16_21610 [Cyanobacteriota bacterium]|nr:hypothetical protein [Cyanobacteriota bacterium]